MNDLRLEEVAEYGHQAGRGDLLGIEPYMTTLDYATEETFRAKLDGYLQAASQKGWLDERTIAVWPEYIGAWLVAAGERASVYHAPSLAAAMRPIALGSPSEFARALISAREKDKIVASLFRIKADRMARIYQNVFSGLATKYRVTIVAGSTVLPSPHVKAGQVVAGRGALYNVSAVFGPDGRAHPALVLKAYPITLELPFTSPSPVSELPAFDAPAGKLGVLICADSWYPDAYEKMKAHGIELLAVPSDGIKPEQWNAPWRGYDGAPAPNGVDARDVGALTEGQAWHTYALAGRMAQSGARCGINVFLRGELWDLGAHGGRAMLVRDDLVADGQTDGAAILNLWV